MIEEGQNLNFEIPIDYARGMLSSNNAQPLAAFYEPEAVPEEPKPTEAEVHASAQPPPAPVPPRPKAPVAAAIPPDMRDQAHLSRTTD